MAAREAAAAITLHAELYNLALLCRRHHRLLHEEGWGIGWDGEYDGKNQLVARPADHGPRVGEVAGGHLARPLRRPRRGPAR
jgi:hypothetical protein